MYKAQDNALFFLKKKCMLTTFQMLHKKKEGIFILASA